MERVVSTCTSRWIERGGKEGSRKEEATKVEAITITKNARRKKRQQASSTEEREIKAKERRRKNDE